MKSPAPMDNTPPTPQCANAPFDRSDADAIFRSSDAVDFRLHKLFLSVPSPFFGDMFGLKQPLNNFINRFATVDGQQVPVVLISVDSGTLDCFLRYLYPSKRPAITLSYAASVLDAARKYQVQLVEEDMTKYLETSIVHSPLQVFGLSCKFGLETLAQKSTSTAYQDFSKISSILQFEFFDGMEYLSAGQYYCLLRYFLVPPTVFTCFPSCCTPTSTRNTLPSLGDTAFNLTSADILLEYSAGTYHPAHTAVLITASPVLAKLDIQNSPRDGEPPSLSVKEDTKTIMALIALCYPSHPLSVRTIENFHNLLGIAKRYQISNAEDRLRGQFLRLAENDPDIFRTFFRAISYGWHQEARLVAMQIVLQKRGFSYHDFKPSPEMEEIPAEPFSALLRCLRVAAGQDRKVPINEGLAVINGVIKRMCL